jgi:hypothetical protein
MAKTSSKQNGAGTGVDRAVRAIERLGIVVGALAANQFGDVDLAKKSKRLRRMGFSNVEIASMLGSTPNSVAVSLHIARRKKARGGRKKVAARKRP